MPRCTSCFGWGHSSSECDATKDKGLLLRKPCPDCRTPVTEAQREEHKRLGCAVVNEAQVAK